ncbi:hypothetical protein [Phyllobacterium leguminum]|uniref:Uncharacterized protein n=1 Tax=Phyllobacterium leguminum TaxID=314237 RepID=A0A318T4B3_9HYPH|nr:hypothetical protein [Phyllobacterium leguminum]PYE89642.1 hypothetical protein C7477_103150 [Phyllobacterium leguminum]
MSKGEAPALRMRVENMRLVPATSYDQERLASYRNGSELRVVVTQKKNDALLRKYFAILGRVVADCNTPWKTKDQASEALKLALGVVELSKTVNNNFMQYPRSLAELDEPEFTEFFEQAMALLQNMTGVDPLTLGAEAGDVGEDQPTPTATDLPAKSEDGDNPGEVANDAAPSSATLSDGDKKSLAYLIKQLVASVGPDPQVVIATSQGVAAEYPHMSDFAKEKARTIVKQFMSVCEGKNELSDALEYVCGVAGIDPKDVEGAE